MTFFPEPLRPSEGREEDKLRVDPIEADKKRRGLDWETLPDKKRPTIYGAFLVFLQKLTTLLGREEGQGLSELSEDDLTNGVQELKQVFQILMESDQSSNGKFCSQFSAVWHRLLQGVQVFSHTKRKAFVNEEKLRALLTDIDNYPPNEDHKLGYYLSEFAGDDWLPVPFRDILKQLFTDHRINQSHSILMKWIELISEILQS